MQQSQLMELGVLGLLNEAEGTRETLKERFNHNFGRHQFAGEAVLEGTLSRLDENGYITGRREYALTAEGIQRLEELLREPVPSVDDPHCRPQLLVKLGFLHHLPSGAQHEELAHLEDQFIETREKWLDIATSHDDADVEPTGYRRQLFELTIDLLDTQREWVRRRRQALEKQSIS